MTRPLITTPHTHEGRPASMQFESMVWGTLNNIKALCYLAPHQPIKSICGVLGTSNNANDTTAILHPNDPRGRSGRTEDLTVKLCLFPFVCLFVCLFDCFSCLSLAIRSVAYHLLLSPPTSTQPFPHFISHSFSFLFDPPLSFLHLVVS